MLDSIFEKAEIAGSILEGYSQEEIDTIVEQIAKDGEANALRLAELAHNETGYGKPEDKKIKNILATKLLWDSIKNVKTVGIIREDAVNKIIEVAAPVGIVAAVIPSTNPTSTTLYKAIISLKGRNPIIFSPHPAAKGCIKETVDLIRDSLKKMGAPEDAVQILENPTIELTKQMMSHPKTGVILATGGLGLVKAAYSSGKPAYGVGPGNVPVFIERTADVEKAVRDVIAGKTFDNGTVCASEQAIIADKPIAKQVVEELLKNNAYILKGDEIDKVAKVVVTEKFSVNPKIVGKPATYIASLAGVNVPEKTVALVAPLDGVGKAYPLSIEKLSPVLALYIEDGWEKACERCIQLLKFGGLGHSLGIHTRNKEVLKHFALKKPASRIIVNSPTTHGAVGYSTNLMPSMTLGCGTLGNNITSENITARHMINVKKVAFETNPVNKGRFSSSDFYFKDVKPEKDVIETILESKLGEIEKSGGERFEDKVYDFVCEDDVKKALRENRKILINDRTMITPLALDEGKKHNIFKKV